MQLPLGKEGTIKVKRKAHFQLNKTCYSSFFYVSNILTSGETAPNRSVNLNFELVQCIDIAVGYYRQTEFC